MDVRLETLRVGEVSVVSVAGEIDVYSAATLRDALAVVVNPPAPQVVVDLRAVEFLDSTGLGVLVGGLKKARSHGGSLRLVCDQERLLKVFRITGLDKVFEIAPTGPLEHDLRAS